MQNLILINKLVKMLKKFDDGIRMQDHQSIENSFTFQQKKNCFKFDRGMNNLKNIIGELSLLTVEVFLEERVH